MAVGATTSSFSDPNSVATWSFSGVAWLATSALLSQLGRDVGKRNEPALFARWGGAPTTVMLRHRSDLTRVRSVRMNSQAVQHARALIGDLVPDLPLPTAAQEQTDPAAADARYAAVVAALRARTSDLSKYRMLFVENCGYGFRRNLWAMRAPGLILSVISTLVLAASVALSDGHGGATSAALGLGCVMLTVWWLVRINADWVKVAAFEYAQQLLMATHVMSTDK